MLERSVSDPNAPCHFHIASARMGCKSAVPTHQMKSRLDARSRTCCNMKTGNPPEQALPVWAPQSGPQTKFVQSDVFEVVYGGARGGGKTDAALGEFALHAAAYGAGARGLLVRRTRVALEPTIARARQIFVDAQWAEQKSRFTWPSGARLSFRHLDNDSHADAYQGHDYSRVYIEELYSSRGVRL